MDGLMKLSKTLEGIAKLPGSEKSMILSCFAGSEGPFSFTFGHILDKVGLKSGAVKQLKRAIFMSSRVLQFPQYPYIALVDLLGKALV